MVTLTGPRLDPSLALFRFRFTFIKSNNIERSKSVTFNEPPRLRSILNMPLFDDQSRKKKHKTKIV